MEKREMVNALIEHYANGNKAEMARILGLSPQAINTWISRNTFDLELIYAKCECINPDWLLTGTGPMIRPDQSAIQPSTANHDESFIYRLYKDLEAKADRLLEENADLKNEIRRYKEENEVREKFVSDVSSESESTKGSGVKSRKPVRSGGLGVKNKGV